MPEKSQARITYVDYTGETSTVNFNNIQNVTEQATGNTLAKAEEKLEALADAIDDIVLGNQVTRYFRIEDFSTSIPPTDKDAQRERKWLVTCIDDEQTFTSVPPVTNVGYGRRFSFELPCADLSRLPSGGGPQSNFLDLSAGVGKAFKDAVEAFVKSPTGGDCKVLSVQHVGRNN